MMKVFIKGLNSCPMRKQKLVQYQRFLQANGHVITDSPETSDVNILWTCAFREDVRENSLSEIQRYQQHYPGRLVVAGCLPDIDPALLSANFNGPVITWKNDARQMEEFFNAPSGSFNKVESAFGEPNICIDAKQYRLENPTAAVSFHDQFIKLVISEGCHYSCAYCSEKLTFPEYHSFDPEVLANLAEKYVKHTGCKDIILVADSLGQYGGDIGTDLPELIRKICLIDPDIRIALNNFNPACFIKFKTQILDLLDKGKIRHLNLPIQSGSDKVLNMMNREYTSADIDEIFSSLRKRNFTEFDTHIIVGFPGETDENFQQTLELLKRHKPKYVLASGFMESPQMPAAALPDKIEPAIRQHRLMLLYEQLTKESIICNTEDSELALDRCRRLNAAK